MKVFNFILVIGFENMSVALFLFQCILKKGPFIYFLTYKLKFYINMFRSLMGDCFFFFFPKKMDLSSQKIVVGCLRDTSFITVLNSTLGFRAS